MGTVPGDPEPMTQEDIRVRSLYLLLVSSRAVEEFKNHLAATFPAQPLSARLQLDRAIWRELGMLFRYWITRQVWDLLEDHEEDAKALNVALLRLFTENFRLPRDGSGLRYAELSTPAEEVQELMQRLTNALEMTHQPMLEALQGGILSWRDAIARHTIEALQWPIEELAVKIKEWAEQIPDMPSSSHPGI